MIAGNGAKDSDNLAISHEVKQYEFMYEPLYFGSSHCPDFEEMFIGYDMDRNSQVECFEI